MAADGFATQILFDRPFFHTLRGKMVCLICAMAGFFKKMVRCFVCNKKISKKEAIPDIDDDDNEGIPQLFYCEKCHKKEIDSRLSKARSVFDHKTLESPERRGIKEFGKNMLKIWSDILLAYREEKEEVMDIFYRYLIWPLLVISYVLMALIIIKAI